MNIINTANYSLLFAQRNQYLKSMCVCVYMYVVKRIFDMFIHYKIVIMVKLITQ